jgi:hypothetical protein
VSTQTRWTPPPPPLLARRVAAEVEAARDRGSVSDETLTGAHLSAAESLFVRILRDGCTSRTSALDLLVVDALVTYAFELDEGSPAEIEALAERFMARLAALTRAAVSSDP